MNKAFKSIILTSLFLILFGLSLLWFGLKPQTNSPHPTPQIVETTPVATSSTTLTTGTSAVVGVEGELVKVLEVIDGDTIKVEGNVTVRLLGIDTPETKDPRKPVQCFGKEASNETKRLVGGKVVILEKDVSETDKYGRLLRYVFLPIRSEKLLFLNDYLIREGFARVLTYPPDVKYTEQFLQGQQEAKENNRGLWGRC